MIEVAGKIKDEWIAHAGEAAAPALNQPIGLSFEEEMRLELEGMMREFPEADRGVMRGQAIAKVKEARKEREAAGAEEAPVKVGRPGESLDVIAGRLGLVFGSQLKREAGK